MFGIGDKKEAWVVAREKKFRLIEKFTLEHIPRIKEMPTGYQFRYHIPFDVQYHEFYPCHDRTILSRTSQYLGILRFGGVGSACGVCLGWFELTDQPSLTSCGRTRDGFDSWQIFDHFFMYDISQWADILAEQLPDFFRCCNMDIENNLKAMKVDQEDEMRECEESVRKTKGLLSFFRWSMR